MTKPGKITIEYHGIPKTCAQSRFSHVTFLHIAPWRSRQRPVPRYYVKPWIIKESSSPWMAPALFVPKKAGDICLCIDYVWGLFEFNRMQFGLASASSSFQKLKNKLFHDNIHVYRQSFSAFNYRGASIAAPMRSFQWLKEAGLMLRGKKCHIGMTGASVHWSCFFSNRNGIWPGEG